MIKSLFIICVLSSGFIVNAMPSINAKTSSINYSAKTVIGRGRTYTAAMKDAKARMPRGKAYYSMTSKRSGGYYYVTLYYR